MLEEINYTKELEDSQSNIVLHREVLKKFVKDVLIEKEDYGLIPGIPTPTLFKAGAEKILAAHGCGRITEITKSIFDPSAVTTVHKKDWNTKQNVATQLEGCFIYEVSCHIVRKRDGAIIGSGIGAANSFEKKFASQGDCYATQNTIAKMAEKRSMVDAALTLSGVSGMFTQDVEDMDLEAKESISNNNYSKPISSNTTAQYSAGTIDEEDDDWIVDFGGPQFKGLPLSSLNAASIQWYAKAVQKNINEGKFVEKNKLILEKIKKVASKNGIVL